jgi:hypothetical protein
LGEEPEPFVLEVDHRTDPWTLKDVTNELVEAGHQALANALKKKVDQKHTARHPVARPDPATGQ